MSYKGKLMLYVKYPLVWSQERIDKVIAKHKITPEEVDEVIFDSNFICHSYGKGEGKRECVYGQSLAGRYIFVVLARHGSRAGQYKVITAREMQDTERRYYKKRG